ncbi:hypothetical protein Pint_26098 [Pistacia integerrima]|uniref:Uncharacterized protein n=1 Tax=Pistacia integerrima TaxID=434235 RepID=A0ACC0YFA7_9ROSI|nr:hypothetical protein Pint_26098 [Pistacia integerrima]
MVKSVCSSALQSCTDLIGDKFSYLHSYKANFENLRAQVEKLTLVRQRALHKIDVAEINMVEIQNDVREWLSSVENLLSEADQIMKDIWKTNNWTRCQLSKKAARNVKTIDLLLSQGENFFEIVSHLVLDEISSLITSSQTLFFALRNYKSCHVNLRTEVEKLMDAKQRVQHMMDIAIRNGETIYEDVLKWVINVEEVADDTRRTFEIFGQKANTRCLLCPDLITRYHLGNKAVRQLKAVVKLPKRMSIR